MNARRDERRLTALLGVIFLALLVPSAALTLQSLGQLRSESFHQYRLLAEELARRIDGEVRTLVAGEEKRSFADYEFLVVSGDDYVTRSPLSQLPVASDVPGAHGYFQVDADGNVRTPLLPREIERANAFGISAAEHAERTALENEIRALLQRATSPEPGRVRREAESDVAAAGIVAVTKTQALFDALREQDTARAEETLGRMEGLDLRRSVDTARVPPSAPPAVAPPRAKRIETNRSVEALLSAPEEGARPTRASLGVFAGEVDPMHFAKLDGEHFVLFRTVWREGERLIQGLVIRRAPFVEAMLAAPFRDTLLAQMSDLTIAYEGDVIAVHRTSGVASDPKRGPDVAGELLYRTTLDPPLDAMELVFSIAELPLGPGAGAVLWAAGLLLVVLVGGFLLMHRVGVRRIRLAHQQQDFVSAVSHELKTPLTSLRMYGEILEAGWASEEKRREYYRFIVEESERLGRLVDNVLRLARLERNGADLALERVAISELFGLVESKLGSHLAQSGFALERADANDANDAMHATVAVDRDAITQVLINLVDNAVKFSAKSGAKRLVLGSRRQGDSVEIYVRDFGPGIPRGEMRRIFTLFYRSGDELTRETAGTGIGLALVRRLVDAMGGRVDVVNREPGAEFRVVLPVGT